MAIATVSRPSTRRRVFVWRDFAGRIAWPTFPTTASTGVIERWGSGTLNIIDWCTENANPKPTWREQAGSVYVNFLPATQPANLAVTDHGSGQVTSEVRLVKVLMGGMSRQDLRSALDLKDDEHFRKTYLLPAIEAGLIEMTIPEKPRSSKQKYRLTETRTFALAVMWP